jgi:hypothetical protein
VGCRCSGASGHCRDPGRTGLAGRATPAARATRFASCGARLVVCDAPLDSALRLLVGRVQMSAPHPVVGIRRSTPGPPSKVSAPLPPMRISLPNPPSSQPFPAPPDRMSSPFFLGIRLLLQSQALPGCCCSRSRHLPLPDYSQNRLPSKLRRRLWYYQFHRWARPDSNGSCRRSR